MQSSIRLFAQADIAKDPAAANLFIPLDNLTSVELLCDNHVAQDPANDTVNHCRRTAGGREHQVRSISQDLFPMVIVEFCS